MRKIYSFVFLAVICCVLNSTGAKACYANFTHTNACPGDTIWVYAAEIGTVQNWDFGDSSSSANEAYGDTAYHIYTAPGTYYITHFVEVGAEFAFETDAITIDTVCFQANFTSACSGGLYINFTSTSVGNNLTYSWDFGEPSSGTANTDNTAGPYHYYNAPGAYTVTLTISDGTNTSTSTQVVNVTTDCLSATYSYSMNGCAGTATTLYVSFSGATSATWDFGDPSSGANNFYTGTGYGIHTYATPGLYFVTIVYTDGVTTNTLVAPTLITDCTVWSGDCNKDGNVSPEDIFPIGLYYGYTGTVRSGASSAWSSQACTDWGNVMYLSDMVNPKHADANGDGVINAADLTAITQNFSKVHNNPKWNIASTMQLVLPNAPAFKIQLPATLYAGANTADLQIGDATNPCGYIYGYSVAIPYDPAFIDPTSIAVDFANSWLDVAAQTNLLTWSYNDQLNHVLYIASVRNNQHGMQGYGAVGHIHYNILPTASGSMVLNILPNAKLLSNSIDGVGDVGGVQNYINARILSSAATVLSVSEVTKNAALKVSPVPTSGTLNFTLDNTEKIKGISIIDISGREVMQLAIAQKSVDLSKLSNGIYWLKVTTEATTYQKKIEVIR